jgi:hypothetical protein
MEDPQSLESTISNTTNPIVYPYCYKIKESCLPCNDDDSKSACAVELIKYMNSSLNKETKEKSNDELFECLKQYGDIYKKLNIELYVNPKSKSIIYPDNQRIQSNLNEYLRNININNVSKESLEENMMLYNILLNDNLRNIYNGFYYANGFSDIKSIQPKKYGIDRLLESSDESSQMRGSSSSSRGGRRRKTIKRRRNNKKKTNKRRNKRTRK